MAVTSAVASALTKAGAEWVIGQFEAWQKNGTGRRIEEREWQSVATRLLKHTKAIESRLGVITTVAFPREKVPLRSIYVSLSIKTPDRSSHEVNSFPRALFDAHPKIMLIDVAGMGKSTASRIIFLKALEERAYLPILVDLRRLKGERIEDVVAKQTGIATKRLDILEEFLTEQPLLFIFDGFDEVGDSSKLAVSRQIRSFVDRASNGRFLITSRPELIFSDYTDFANCHIEPLTRPKAEDLITKYGAAFGIPDRAKALLEELKAKHGASVGSFLQNPLLASLVFRAFEYKSIIPVKRSVFYRQVFDALFDSHDLNKETGFTRDKRTGLHHDDFHRVMRALASLYRQRRRVEVEREEFIRMAGAIVARLCPDLSFGAEDLLLDCTAAVPLLTVDGSYIRWSHKSLLDYFLCEFLLRDYSRPREEALRRIAFGDDAYSGENFLTLVQEADPILFSKAVTVPACEYLLARYDAVSDALPVSLERDLAQDIAMVFAACEVLVWAPDSSENKSVWECFLDYGNDRECIDADRLFARVMYHLDQSRMIGLFVRAPAAALHVPVQLRAIPAIPFHEVARKYRDDAFGPEDFEFTSEPARIYEDLAASNFKHVADEFRGIVGFLQSSEMVWLFRADELRQVLHSHREAIRASIDARSDDVF